MNKKFWMIWNQNGNSPTRKHESRQSAEMEAERLAGGNTGCEFFILEAVCKFQNKPMIEKTELQ